MSTATAESRPVPPASTAAYKARYAEIIANRDGRMALALTGLVAGRNALAAGQIDDGEMETITGAYRAEYRAAHDAAVAAIRQLGLTGE